MEDQEQHKAQKRGSANNDNPALSDLSALSPPRSRTDPLHNTSIKPASRNHAHSVTRRLHANSLLGRDRGERHHHSLRHSAKDHIQSATELKPPVSFENFLRRDKKRGGNDSTDSSRRGSQKATSPNVTDSASESHTSPQEAIEWERKKHKHITEAHVVAEREKNKKRQEELSERLKSLEELGMQSMRQLDDTYYMILEKASNLRTTVLNLQKLADQSMKVHSTFETDASALEKETKDSMKGWDGFKQQQEVVDGLVEKLKNSQSQTEKLNGRLDVARKRVEAYDARQKREQSRRENRWRMICVTIGAVVVVMLSLLIVRHRKGMVASMPHFGALPVHVKPRPKQAPDEDPYLSKLFDEL